MQYKYNAVLDFFDKTKVNVYVKSIFEFFFEIIELFIFKFG